MRYKYSYNRDKLERVRANIKMTGVPFTSHQEEMKNRPIAQQSVRSVTANFYITNFVHEMREKNTQKKK